jgi:hypothetical protein
VRKLPIFRCAAPLGILIVVVFYKYFGALHLEKYP